MWTAERQSEPPAENPFDLRRKPRADLARTIVQRAAALPPQERTLVLSVFDLGRPVAEVGRLLGIRGDPRSLRRRLRHLAARLLTPEFAYVVGNRDAWTPARRMVATEAFVHGRSCRQIAREHGMSFHVVRVHMRVVKELARARGGRR
jgi:DNA-directed RNA polymerase specialized sigma24 family protein